MGTLFCCVIEISKKFQRTRLSTQLLTQSQYQKEHDLSGEGTKIELRDVKQIYNP